MFKRFFICRYKINGEDGWGVTEWEYRYKMKIIKEYFKTESQKKTHLIYKYVIVAWLTFKNEFKIFLCSTINYLDSHFSFLYNF